VGDGVLESGGDSVGGGVCDSLSEIGGDRVHSGVREAAGQ
jgi:hypothetical protein